MMTYQAWICEGCGYPNRKSMDVWGCPSCDKETCEHCFDRYSHCKPCAAGKTDEELRLAANAAGGDFEPMTKSARIGAFDYTENTDGTITRKDWRDE